VAQFELCQYAAMSGAQCCQDNRRRAGRSMKATMTTRNHAIVWIDHLTARVFYVGLSGVDEVVLHAHLSTEHLHHKANSIGVGHVADDPRFLSEVAAALAQSGEILIIGPGGEKAALHHYLQQQQPKIAAAVVGVETSDHPSDAQIVALAKRHFRFTPAERR
jgi:stalled ribosome rescue protein Dom34